MNVGKFLSLRLFNPNVGTSDAFDGCSSGGPRSSGRRERGTERLVVHAKQVVEILFPCVLEAGKQMSLGRSLCKPVGRNYI